MSETTANTILSATLERFNPAQREAVSNLDGPMLIIAGAGSGKTSVLTARIALLLENGVAPERILALTFTKKAAEEMRSRIMLMEGDKARRLCMGTFHSVFIRFLRPFASRIGFPENFTILDEEDSLRCVGRAVNEIVGASRPPREQWTKAETEQFKQMDAPYKPKVIQGIISSCKNELFTPQAYAADRARLNYDAAMKRPLTANIYQHYMNICHRSATMDFDDLLLYTDILLERNHDVLGMISGSFDYILVDEYQDTNYAQYSILRRLTWLNKNICVVGDDSQSIYAFRGAKIRNILNFQKEYSDCRTVKLEQNYRSTKNIVSAANNLIGNNETRLEKVCFTDAAKGDPISIRALKNEAAEAGFIADTVRAGLREGKRCKDFAVLYRTNAQSRAIEDALVKGRIPYVVYSGTSFFQRMEVKDLLAYFRLAVNPRDDESFARVVNKPVRGFGPAAQKRLFDIASAWNMSLYDTASNPQIGLCGFAPKALQGLRQFVEDINGYARTASVMGAYNAATTISDAVGMYQEYIAAGDEESMNRADNIRELTDSVKAFEADAEAAAKDIEGEPPVKADLAGYLQTTLLLSNADTDDGTDDKVSLMTVHCAKGLEFDTVIVAGMEKDLFPLEIDKTDFEREEERRLFYVAMTRAKTKLYLTRAEQRFRFGKKQFPKPSMFLGELAGKHGN